MHTLTCFLCEFSKFLVYFEQEGEEEEEVGSVLSVRRKVTWQETVPMPQHLVCKVNITLILCE